MSLITTHVLDTAAGESASGVAVRLGYCEVPEWPWAILNQDKTDANGRLKNLLAPGHVLQPGFTGSVSIPQSVRRFFSKL